MIGSVVTWGRNLLFPEIPEDGGYYTHILCGSPHLYAVYQYRGGRRGRFYSEGGKAVADRHWKNYHKLTDLEVATWKFTGELPDIPMRCGHNGARLLEYSSTITLKGRWLI